MLSIDPQASLKYFRNVAAQADRDVQQRLDRFQQSLETWLHSALNWPLDDWQADLRMFLEHTRYAGWEISPHSLSAIRELLTARAGRTGPFAAEGSKAVDRPVIQLAAVMAPGEDTDATLDLTSDGEEADATPVDLETAGPGPDVSPAFKAKVRLALDLLDPAICQWWHAPSVDGLIKSRDAWGPRRNVMSDVENDRPIIVVDQSFTAGDTALAIIDESSAGLFADSLGVHLRKYKIGRSRSAAEFADWRKSSAQEAAAYAATMAELYYGAIGSLTSSGDVFVTIDDIGRNGLSWNHLLLALPLMTTFRRGLSRLTIVVKGGKKLEIAGTLLTELASLPAKKARELIAKAQRAKTPEKAIEILQDGVKAATAKPPPKGAAGAAKSAARRGPQTHHAISKRVHRSLEEHSKLKGKYKYRDRRFEYKAVSLEAHNGYPQWHVDLDAEVVKWIDENPEATTEAFEKWLAERYKKPDLAWRFKSN